MSGTRVIVELSGQVGLLLWGTHMVTTGVQRGWGTRLRQQLERNLGHRWRAFFTGLGMTTLLQSSTATGLMAMSFTAAGVIALAPALAVMLGANVGTALIAQVLSLNVSVLAAPLVLIGVLVFRWSQGSGFKNVGRAAIGLGLMLMALAGLQHTLAPVENTPVLRSILQAIAADPVLAIALAFVLTWGCHSSVAIVLLVSSLCASHVVGASESLALVLGANLGGTMPPLVHASTAVARRLPLGNLLVRLTGVILIAPWLPEVARLLQQVTGSDTRLVVDFHLAFNLLLAAVFLPVVSNFSKVLIRWLPDPPQPTDPGRPLYLESAALDSASVALANATRETLRMADMLGKMLKDALDVFRTGDRESATEIPAIDAAIRQLGSGIRGYLVAIGSEQTLDDAQEGARLQEIHSAVINIEHVSDIVANGLMDFTVKELKRGQSLSAEEVAAIAAMHAELLESLNLAMAIFLHGDPADAQRLLERKARFRQMEADATAISIRLLRDASAASRLSGDEALPVADGSGLLLRIVRDLRRVHSHLATFAHRSSDQRQHRWRKQATEHGAPNATDTGGKRRSPRR